MSRRRFGPDRFATDDRSSDLFVALGRVLRRAGLLIVAAEYEEEYDALDVTRIGDSVVRTVPGAARVTADLRLLFAEPYDQVAERVAALAAEVGVAAPEPLAPPVEVVNGTRRLIRFPDVGKESVP